jgi:hypothetical protein
MKIIVNRSAASFKGIEHEFVAVLEIVPIELKLIDGGTARMAIPTIRQNYATVIPKQSLYSSHIPSDLIHWSQPQLIVKGFYYLRSAFVAEAKFLDGSRPREGTCRMISL